MDPLQEKADDKVYDRDINAYIKERWPDAKPKQIKFISYLLKGYPGYKAYMLAQGVETQLNSARNQASIWVKKLGINLEELLDFAGHGADQISEVLDNMKTKDPDAYLRHIIKLKKLDIQKIEHSGEIQVPIINIVTERKDEAS